MSFTADGFAFASHPGLDDAVWASDLFNLSAATVDDKGLVILDGVSVSTYHEFLKLHRRRHLLLKHGAACLGLVIWVFAHEQPGGCRVWWGLSTVWKELKVSALRPTDWLSNWWRWWEKRAAKLKFCYPDLRPSVRGKSPPSSSFLAPELAFDGRVLPEAAVSTVAFLMIAIRCGSSRRDNRDEEEAQQWTLLLLAFFRQYLPAAFQIPVPVDIGVPTVPDEHPTGPHMLLECTTDTITIGDGCPGLLGILPDAVQERVDAHGSIPLLMFADLLDATGTAALSIYPHFLRGLAAVLEAQILCDQSDDVVVTLPRVKGAPSRVDLGKTARSMKAARDANTAHMLCKYFYAGRKHFAGEVTYLSLACDATRMGKRSCMSGCIASPANLFMWAPPQAVSRIRGTTEPKLRALISILGNLFC